MGRRADRRLFEAPPGPRSRPGQQALSHPGTMMWSMPKSPITPATDTPAVRFAAIAGRIAERARVLGLRAPGFKTPPRRPGFDRTIRRVGRDTVVSVRVKGRPFGAVIADLIEGIVVANELTGVEASRARSELWEAVSSAELGGTAAA